MNQTSYLSFVSCAPGLEALLGRELAELGFPGQIKEAGVEVRTTFDGVVGIALGSALAEGLRVRLKSFVARDFGALIEGAGRLPWRAYLQSGAPVRVKVTCHRSKLWHSGAVEERMLAVLKQSVNASAAESASEDAALSEQEEANEPATVFVRITGDAVQISVDATGRMHRRGYRTHVERASLRETLAASLLRVASEARPTERPRVIWDPFAGAGTIVCEAARRYSGISPGRERSFAFEKWPTHDEQTLERMRSGATHTASGSAVECIGSDLSERALTAARHNAELGGVTASTHFLVGDFEQIAPQVPQGAWLVTNPPYGERLEQNGLMARLDRLLQKRRDLRPAVLLVGGSAKKELPGHFRNAFTTKNGGLDVSVRILER